METTDDPTDQQFTAANMPTFMSLSSTFTVDGVTALKPVFEVLIDGSLRFMHNFYGSDQNPTYASSIVVDDSSVYVGSARLSYDRANHVLTTQRLKTDHVPLYLQGRGFTANDLPSGHTLNDMSCADWFKWAREHFTEDHLHVHDIFPVANTGDWVVIDAPVPALQAWANGADADITTLETEMDAVEVRVDAKRTGPTGDRATVHVTSATIVYVAVENVLTGGLTAWRPAVVFGFGLLHGLGFAGVLSHLGLPAQEQLLGLVSFNLGIELGQLLVIGVAFVAIGRYRGQRWYRTRITLTLSVVISVIGLFWTVERILVR